MRIELHEQTLTDGSKVYDVHLVNDEDPEDLERIQLPAIDQGMANTLVRQLQTAITNNTNIAPEVTEHFHGGQRAWGV